MANEHTKCPMTEDQIKHMVNRFLAWKLPDDFTPDAGISFKPFCSWADPSWPVGTNLFTATMAEAMIRYMVDGIQHGGVCLWCGFSTTKGSLDELADAIYAHLGECHASPVPALQSAIRASEARERELRDKLFELDCKAMGEDWGHTLCAEQRDAALAQVGVLERKLQEETDNRVDSAVEAGMLRQQLQELMDYRGACHCAMDDEYVVGRIVEVLALTDGSNTYATAQQFVEKVRREALEEAVDRVDAYVNQLHPPMGRAAAPLRAAILGQKENR